MMSVGAQSVLSTAFVLCCGCSLLFDPLELTPVADSGPDSPQAADGDFDHDDEPDSGEEAGADTDFPVDSEVDEEQDVEIQPCVESWTPESCGSAPSRCDGWWDTDYTRRRPIRVHGGAARDFPVLLRFDSSTTPTAEEVYLSSESAHPGDDMRIVYQGDRQLHRYIEEFTTSSIRIWFSLQSSLGSYRSVTGTEQSGTIADSSSALEGSWSSVHDGSWLDGYRGEYGTDPWVIFDISGSAIPIYKIRIKNAVTSWGEAERVVRFRVELSADGVDSGDFHIVLDEAVIGDSYRRFHDFTFSPTDAEYVKLILLDNFSGESYHDLTVSEFEAYEHTEDDSSYALYYGNPDAGSGPIELTSVFPPGRDDDTWLLSYFEDVGDSITDHSLHERQGTTYNHPESVPGVFGRALRFQEDQEQFLEYDYSEVPCSTFTVEAFVDSDAAGDSHRYAVGTGWRWSLRWWDLMPSFSLNGDEWNSVGPWYVSSDRFFHYAMTFDGTTMALYIDGQRVESKPMALTHDCFEQGVNVARPSYLGDYDSPYTSMAIDGLRISSIARTDFDYALPGNQVDVDVSCEELL